MKESFNEELDILYKISKEEGDNEISGVIAAIQYIYNEFDYETFLEAQEMIKKAIGTKKRVFSIGKYIVYKKNKIDIKSKFAKIWGEGVENIMEE